jgi:hypothetical protein
MTPSMLPDMAAGTVVTVNVRVSCPGGCDLRGKPVNLISHEGIVMVQALATYDENTNVTEDFALELPKEAGEYTWNILFPREESEGVIHEGSALRWVFRTVPHRTSVAVWDVPSCVSMTTSFKVKVGVRCSAMCQFKGLPVEVRDKTGVVIGKGALGDTIWTGTSALYWTEIELAAPIREGIYLYSVLFAPTAEMEVAHERASGSFSVRVDRAPESRVVIRVLQKETRAAMDDVEVWVGRYMTSTDTGGIANFELPNGTYEICIRKDGYTAQPISLHVSQDLTVDVEVLSAPTKAEMEERLNAWERAAAMRR